MLKMINSWEKEKKEIETRQGYVREKHKLAKKI